MPQFRGQEVSLARRRAMRAARRQRLGNTFSRAVLERMPHRLVTAMEDQAGGGGRLHAMSPADQAGVRRVVKNRMKRERRALRGLLRGGLRKPRTVR